MQIRIKRNTNCAAITVPTVDTIQVSYQMKLRFAAWLLADVAQNLGADEIVIELVHEPDESDEPR